MTQSQLRLLRAIDQGARLTADGLYTPNGERVHRVRRATQRALVEAGVLDERYELTERGARLARVKESVRDFSLACR